jgi:hypothetical protein
MRRSLQSLPYQLWPNTTRGSKFFITKAKHRVSVAHSDFRNIHVIPAISAVRFASNFWPLTARLGQVNVRFAPKATDVLRCREFDAMVTAA